MHARYTSVEMSTIWSDDHRYELWTLVESAVVAGYCAIGKFPEETSRKLAAFPAPSAEAVEEAEKTAKHDVVAFLQAWTADMPSSLSSRVHRGLTSSDVVDTALALQIHEASQILLDRAARLSRVLREHAREHLETQRVGRTHGQHASTDTWGHRVADFALAVARAELRLQAACDELRVAQISGAVGTYETVPRSVEVEVAASLRLTPSPVSTQVVMRDRLASWLCELALLATICEAIAIDIRIGQMTEIDELREGASAGQIGSSAVPAKRNPIGAEKICGLSRVVRGYVSPVMEGIPLWGQRDISHSSVERVVVPDCSALVEHILQTTADLIERLEVDADRMRELLHDSEARVASAALVVGLMDLGMPYLEAHSLVDTTLREEPAEDLVPLLTAAAVQGLGLDQRIIEQVLSQPRQLDLSPIGELLRNL